MGRSPGRWPSRWSPCLVCGSLGSTLALWREKTFQALAMTVLVLVLWLAAGEVLAAGVLGETVLRAAVPHAGGRSQPLAGHSRGRPPLGPRPAGARAAGHAGQSVSGRGRGRHAAAERRGRGDGAGVEPVEGRTREERGEGRRGESERRRGIRNDSPRQRRSALILLSPSPLFPLLRPPAASGTIP